MEAQLEALGFRPIATDVGRHPGVGHALYVLEPEANPKTKAALVHWQQEAERLAVREVQLAEQLARLDTLLTEAQASRDAHAAKAVALEAGKTQAEQGLQQSTQANQALENRLRDSTQALAQRADELATAQAALEAATHRAKELEKAKTQAEQALQQSTQQIQTLMAREQVLSAETTRLTAALSSSQQQLSLAEQEHQKSMATLQATCSAIEKELANQQAGLTKALAAEFTQQLQQHAAALTTKQQEACKESETRSRAHIDKALANAVKQLEAFQAIQGFLTTGEAISNFHGWPISPDIGLFLLEKIQSNRYDLIIEFGSGTSTLLFAKAIQVLRRQGNTGASDAPPGVQKPVLTFEHDQKYLETTRELLMANGADSLVELIHAPLVDWSDSTQAYLYYDCAEKIQEVASNHKKEHLKILVLIDGPPGATCANARYPGIPIVFNALGKHQIDLVLDDANRPEEKSAIDLWRSHWKQRSIRMTEYIIPSEKGLYYATNNSK